jgi:tRNA-dihydrouridine synthase
MIGRATVGRPWIFKEIKDYLAGGEDSFKITLAEKVDIAKKQFAKSLEWKGEPRGIYEMRRHFSQYFKGLPDFKELRLQLVTCNDTDEIYRLLDLILERYRYLD